LAGPSTGSYVGIVPDRSIGYVNVVFMYVKLMLCWREAGAGDEGNARGARAVEFNQGT
jgi:hypothetical protein